MAKVATKVLDHEAKGVEFTFEGGEPQMVLLSDFSPEIQLHLALHGLSQKLGDSYSSSKGVVADAEAMFTEAHKQLLAGDWRAARGEGDSKPRTGELAEAISRIKNLPVEDVQKSLAGADEATRKTLRSNERVKAMIAVIRAEKAQAKLAKLEASGANGLDI